MSRNSTGSSTVRKAVARVGVPTVRALEQAGDTVSKSCEGLTRAAAQEITKHPIGYVIGALGAGFLLGRWRVRPVETVGLAAVTGLVLGLALPRERGE